MEDDRRTCLWLCAHAQTQVRQCGHVGVGRICTSDQDRMDHASVQKGTRTRRRTEAFDRLRKDKGLEWKHGATYNALL